MKDGEHHSPAARIFHNGAPAAITSCAHTGDMPTQYIPHPRVSGPLRAPVVDHEACTHTHSLFPPLTAYAGGRGHYLYQSARRIPPSLDHTLRTTIPFAEIPSNKGWPCAAASSRVPMTHTTQDALDLLQQHLRTNLDPSGLFLRRRRRRTNLSAPSRKSHALETPS